MEIKCCTTIEERYVRAFRRYQISSDKKTNLQGSLQIHVFIPNFWRFFLAIINVK